MVYSANAMKEVAASGFGVDALARVDMETYLDLTAVGVRLDKVMPKLKPEQQEALVAAWQQLFKAVDDAYSDPDVEL